MPHTSLETINENTILLISAIFENCITDMETKNLHFVANNVREYLTNMQIQLNDFNSIYKRNKIIHSKVVLPGEISIGMTREKVFDKYLNIRRDNNIPCTFM